MKLESCPKLDWMKNWCLYWIPYSYTMSNHWILRRNRWEINWNWLNRLSVPDGYCRCLHRRVRWSSAADVGISRFLTIRRSQPCVWTAPPWLELAGTLCVRPCQRWAQGPSNLRESWWVFLIRRPKFKSFWSNGSLTERDPYVIYVWIWDDQH